MRKKRILFMSDRIGYFTRELLRGIIDVSKEREWWDVWTSPAVSERQQLEKLVARGGISGVIARGVAADTLVYLRQLGVPVVELRGPAGFVSEEQIGPHADDYAVGQIAASEFQRLGVLSAGYVHWEGVLWSKQRGDAFTESINWGGCEWLRLEPEESTGWTAIEKIADWLESKTKPIGVLGCCDQVGLAVLQACVLINARVPEEVAVIGVDNDVLACDFASPALSSIDLNPIDIGRAAAIHLARRLDLTRVPREEEVRPPYLVARGSSHRVDRYLQIYQSALYWMDQNALRGASVSEVATACGYSRRGLERAFGKHAGTSPGHVLRDIKTQAIIKLLQTQNLPLEKIAAQSGFPDASSLGQFIKRQTGKSPGELRQLDH
ncbi:substrate-binding domain-containing protein [Persicirhabdus sediminis]|uniref:Substrate-binding domain-containing protein n=1 Tax=Persicirhabdus sediminis TaxID=454144 RepID=A0A8J7SIN5_9BACT|nr:substrate-binding domain-containing protein [Persicirhabdus sediminis]MBK1790571.1 substrate-binding domain-containing protein [Persicirhabdus sediminis]